MKHLRSLVATTTIILFIIGFSAGSFALKLTETYVKRETIGLSFLELLTPNLSLGFLLAFCSLSAGVILLAYNKTNLSYSPSLVFVLGLLVSLISAFISIWLHLWQLRVVLSQLSFFAGTPLTVRGINYFSSGSTIVLLVSGMITIYFLWIPYLKEDQVGVTAMGQNVNKKYLSIATVAFLVFAFVSFIIFIFRMLITI